MESLLACLSSGLKAYANPQELPNPGRAIFRAGQNALVIYQNSVPQLLIPGYHSVAVTQPIDIPERCSGSNVDDNVEFAIGSYHPPDDFPGAIAEATPTDTSQGSDTSDTSLHWPLDTED